MPTIVRKKSKPYKWVVGHVTLSEVANVEKKVPRDYITEDGFGITEKCRAYLRAADRGRGLPAVQERPAGLREDQGRGGEEEAQYRVQALKSCDGRCARPRAGTRGWKCEIALPAGSLAFRKLESAHLVASRRISGRCRSARVTERRARPAPRNASLISEPRFWDLAAWCSAMVAPPAGDRSSSQPGSSRARRAGTRNVAW